MANKGKDQSSPAGDSVGDGKKPKRKHGIPSFSCATKDAAEKKSWFSFPAFLPKMQV